MILMGAHKSVFQVFHEFLMSVTTFDRWLKTSGSKNIHFYSENFSESPEMALEMVVVIYAYPK